jgi:flavin reductase (DIM6/NTAB) family NADH-FMN oxidoreductase RutF
MSEDAIKDALQMIPYGFYAITSRSEEEVNIMVANWLSQVSFTPRLLALGLAKNAYSDQLIARGRVFTVNIFRREDAELIKPFTKSRAKNPDKVKMARFTPAPETGCPVIEGAAAYIECRVVAVLDVGGDHRLVVGEAVHAAVNKPGKAGDTLTLSDLGWNYAG